MIAFKNISKSFQIGKKKISILQNLDFEIQAGEIVALVGPSGSGKSTLLSLLSGLDKPDSGEIWIQGLRTDSLSENEMTDFRRDKIGIVFQQYYLLPHLTALENVMFPLEVQKILDPESKAKILLSEVGLSDRLYNRPSKLSGGESQRVAIARALIHSPAIVLADEPSGNLDAATGDQVMHLFFERLKARKQTCLLVTHNSELAAKCDRVLKLHNGSFQ